MNFLRLEDNEKSLFQGLRQHASNNAHNSHFFLPPTLALGISILTQLASNNADTDLLEGS
jgi:hypothetical protein